MSRRLSAVLLTVAIKSGCLLTMSLSCTPSVNAPAAGPPSAAECQANRSSLIELLDSLPEKGLALRGRSDLPVASLGGVIGAGRVVDVTADSVLLDGTAIVGNNPTERQSELGRQLADGGKPTPEAPLVPRPLIYLAVEGSMDARTLRGYLSALPRAYDVHLVFQAPPPESAGQASSASVSERLLSETDLPTRHALAREAYREYARCAPVQTAVDGVAAGDPLERWPALRAALIGAVPQCDCADLDSEPLRELLLAEQRAGAAAVGAVPVDFMRDERCGASFGMSPVQKIMQDIQAFDEEFAGQYGHESIDFAQVVTNERLLTYLCPALPGETLAALQRLRHTFYWKIRGQSSCQGWQFEPLAPGSPMGTWRRQGMDAGPPLAIHYWQGAEEIRLYGPLPSAESKPTDEHVWACDQDFRMRGIDAASIELEHGRWFFDLDTCQKAMEDAAFPGCIAALAGGPPELPPAVPATFPALGDGVPESPSP
jgi:hypothetical protein